MKLQVTHETRYDYAPPVRTARHLAHLKPLHTQQQRLLSHALEVQPEPIHMKEVVDVFGNTGSFFTLTTHHEQLRVVARSVVETQPHDGIASGIAWEDVRERMRYRRGAVYDPACEFVFASPFVPRHEEFAAYARPSFTARRPWLHAATELMQRVHDEFRYEPQATDVSTPAREALAMRRGVCQDFAHVMLACLRSLGLPARYVSGYLLTEPPPGQARLVGCDASHAWVSVYVPGDEGRGQWVDLDPTNRRTTAEDYVTLAIGRDYSDVTPLRGVIHGGANHRLHVAVTVAPASQGAVGS